MSCRTPAEIMGIGRRQSDREWLELFALRGALILFLLVVAL
jgi:hypothetical protein